MALIALADRASPLEVQSPVLYAVPLALQLWVRRSGFLWVTAVLCVLLTFGIYAWQAPGGPNQHALVGRLLVAVVMIATATLLQLHFTSTGSANRAPGGLDPALVERWTRLLTAASHEIRSPANAINLMTEVLARAATVPEMAAQVPEMAGKLRAQALAMVALATDILDMLRLDIGGIELRPSEFPLPDLVAEECRSLQTAARRKGIDLTASAATGSLWIRADRLRLGRAIRALLAYAVQMSDTGRVDVAVERSADGGPRISCAAPAVSLNTEDRVALFDEFVQLRNPARERSQGTGFSVAVSKRLLQTLGGSLCIEPQPGDGTSLVVSLPTSMVVPIPAA